MRSRLSDLGLSLLEKRKMLHFLLAAPELHVARCTLVLDCALRRLKTKEDKVEWKKGGANRDRGGHRASTQGRKGNGQTTRQGINKQTRRRTIERTREQGEREEE